MLLLFESIATVKVNSKKYFLIDSILAGYFQGRKQFSFFVRRRALRALPTPRLSGKTRMIIAGVFPVDF
jgi:hypothetical protein